MELLLFIIAVLVLYFVLKSQKSSRIQPNQKQKRDGLKNLNRRTRIKNSRIQADYDENESLTTFSVYSGNIEEKSKNNVSGKWAKKGELINIKDLEISGGMFYYGGQLASVDGYVSEASLVDDSLKTINQSITYEDESLGYWPRYNAISASCRGAYINWLASNRDDPETPLGYVFIYFYGLERRIIVDSLKNDVNDTEYQGIFYELLRLREVYSKSRSFLNYSTRLLEIMCLLRPGLVSHPDLENNPTHDSILFKYHLAKKVHDVRPIPSHLALSWLKFSPDYNLKTPARRCSDEFDEMFMRLYAKKYGDGIVVKPNKTRLNLGYYPASPSLRGVSIPQEDFSDPSNLKRPIKKLTSIADHCTNALDPYSRYLGKKGNSRSDILAVLLLPNELSDIGTTKMLSKFKIWAEESILKRGGLVDFNDYWAFTQLPLPAKINKKESELIQMLAEKIDFGIVPDYRYHHAKPSPNGKLVLFKGGHGENFSPSKTFNEIGMTLRLGAMVASIDSHVDQTESILLKQLIDQNPNLSTIEKRSLHYYLVWRLNTPSNVRGLKARLRRSSVEERTAVSHILIKVALADGKIEIEEIKQLERIYTLLGLDKAMVTSDIHGMSTRNSETSRRDLSSPTCEQNRETAGDFRLNKSALAIHESQTKDVQDMLGAIFVDQELNQEQENENVLGPESKGYQEGMLIDALHYSFYENLIHKDKWLLSELDELCERMGLMTAGAIETVNDWSFEQVNAPVLEEEADAVYVDQEIVEELEN